MTNNLKLVLGFVALGVIFCINSNSANAAVISGGICTYKSEITTWSSCSVGMRYATAASFATTTSESVNCADVATVQACSQDIDGNDFGIINIGVQTWMADNLKTTKYNNGSAIGGNMTWYNNDSNNKNTYGGLYNYLAANNSSICPVGWHAPVENDWAILRTFTGGDALVSNGTGYVFPTAGVKLKTFARGGTNNYAFSAVGGGKIDSDYAWVSAGLNQSYWWVANSHYFVSGATIRYYPGDGYGYTSGKSINDNISTDSLYFQYPRDLYAALSVRCVKDTPYVPVVSETCYDSSVATTPKPLSQIYSVTTVPNLVAYYPLNGNANDSRGTNNLSNSAITFPNSSLSNSFSNAGYFNGAATLSLNSTANLLSGGNYSFCTWYKQEALQPMQEFISGREGQSSWTGFEIQTDQYNNNIRAGGIYKSPIPGYSQTTNPSGTFDGNWRQVCYTKQGTAENIYINGEVVASSTTATSGVNPFPVNLIIGRDNYSNGVSGYEYFKGYMDDISIWSKGLSSCEVKSMYLGVNACLPACNDISCYDPSTSVPVPAVQTLGLSTLSSNTYGYYPLTNLTNSGSTVYSNGIVNNATAITTGKFSGAYNLPGLNSNLDLGWSGTLLQTSGQKTFSIWIKPDGKQGVVFSKYKTDTVEGGYYLSITALNQLSAGIKSDTWSGAAQGPVYVTPQSIALTSSQWAHVAVTIDTAAKFIKLYVNGDLVGSNTSLAGTFTNANAPFLIGSQWYGGNTYNAVSADQPYQANNTICTYINCFYRGGVDDFFVVDKVLTDCEIKKLAKGPDACLIACSATSTVSNPNPVNVQTGGGPGTIVGQSGYCGGNAYLSWAYVASSTKYHIYESNGVEVASTTGNQIVIKSTASSTHSYKIKSENNGVLSTIFSTTTPSSVVASGACLPPITSISGTALCGNRIDLNWSSNSPLYRIDRAQCVQNVTDGGSCANWNSWVQVFPTAENSWIDSGLTWNKVYKYRINATSSEGMASSVTSTPITLAINTSCTSPFTCRIISPTVNGKVTVNSSSLWTGTSTTNISSYAKDWTIVDNGIASHLYDRNPLSKIFTTIGDKSISLSVFGSNYMANCGTATTTVINSGGIGEQ